MNILILTPDRVGSTLLQRLITVYAKINEKDKVSVNLHELTNGLTSYHSSKFGIDLLGKKEKSWGYHQSLNEIVEMLSSRQHDVTSRLAYYHLKNRKDSIADQLSFYEYLNDNFFIISARRKNLLEHAVSWGITVESKKLNVYTFEEKYKIFKDIHAKGINIDQNTIKKYLNQYQEYLHWADAHFNVNAYFDYEDHLPNLEHFILNLTPFRQAGYTTTWKDYFDIEWNDWNRMHYLLSLHAFGQEYTDEEKTFIKDNIERYSHARTFLQDMTDDGLLVSSIPIKLHTMSDKSKIVHNLENCLDTYNKWISSSKVTGAIAYTQNDIVEQAKLENTNWKSGSADSASLLTYNDVSEYNLKKSDLKHYDK